MKTTTTTLCKNLINNASFTNRFIGKSIGESIYKKWIEALTEVKHNAFLYYEAEATGRTEEQIEQAEKLVYTSIKNLLSLVGEIPTKDGQASTKINSSVLFLDSVRYAVNDNAKIEVEKLKKARQTKADLTKAYKKACLTDSGIVKNGLTEAYIASFTKPIDEANKQIEALLNKANNSVFGTEEAKISTFAKKFEIQLRKAIINQYNFTVKEANAQKQAQKQTRKANRSKKAEAKTTTK